MMMLQLRTPTFIIIGALFLAPVAIADFAGTEAVVVLDNPVVRTGVGAGQQTRGYTFNLESPRTLTHLGLFLYNGTDSADVPRQIGLWDADGTLVAEVTIPVGGGEIEDLGSGGKFVYGELTSPVILLPLVDYTVGVWYSANNSPGLAFEVGFTTIPGFNYVATVETGPPGGAFAQPTIVRLDRLNAYIGPNLRFDLAIPTLQNPSIRVTHDANADMLSIKWDSEGGKIYDILSSIDLLADPESWPVYSGLEDLATTPPENTVRISRPADGERFFVVRERVPPPTTYFADGFEGGNQWTAGSPGAIGTAWEIGSPSGVFGPTSAQSGTNCYGTNLAGSYGIDADVWLRSPVIDLTDPTLASAMLTFYQFKDMEGLGFDFGSIRVLDATTDLPLGDDVESPIDGFSSKWEVHSVALPPEVLGRMIKIEFRFVSDVVENFAGWYLDDIVVTGR
jgi:hypothetical protein